MNKQNIGLAIFPSLEAQFKPWAINSHIQTNHLYDNDLPYSFHLKMVVNEVNHFLDKSKYSYEGSEFSKFQTDRQYSDILKCAAWGHDLIEDTRTSYSDIFDIAGKAVAEIIFALTNEKGKNRNERASDKYYEGIINTPGAAFIKFCDRIANVKYGIMASNERMVSLYKEENDHFVKSIYSPELAPLRLKLEKLFNLTEI